MKELSLEEKAKRYDEAIGRANDVLKGYNPKEGSKATINYIFPELKESEEEKIRKELIEHIKANSSSDFVLFQKFSPNDVLAWLEKQGDHKLAWSEEDEERLQSCLNILQVQAKGFMGITETINTKWLKSLKQRHTWKPSDEQINSLEYIIDNAQYLPYSHSVVNELLEQLKKLKRG